MIKYISAMLIFGTLGVFRKNVPVASSVLSCVRGLIGSAFIFLYVKIRKIPLDKKIDRKNLLLVLISGVFIGLNWILLFEAFNYTTVPVASLCYNMEPTIVILLSAILLSEKLTVKKIVCTIVSIVGMVFVSGVLEDSLSTGASLKGILFGLSAAFFYSMIILMNKFIEVNDNYLKTILQLFSASIVILPYAFISNPISSIDLSTKSIILIVILGIVHTGIGYALYFAGMKDLTAQTIAVFSYIDPVSSIIFAAIFLHESMTLFGFIGAVLILGSAFIISKDQ